jgi:hypothetical protein
MVAHHRSRLSHSPECVLLAWRREFATGEVVGGQGYRDPERELLPLRINARVKRTGFPAILLQRQPQRLGGLLLPAARDPPPGRARPPWPGHQFPLPSMNPPPIPLPIMYPPHTRPSGGGLSGTRCSPSDPCRAAESGCAGRLGPCVPCGRSIELVLSSVHPRLPGARVAGPFISISLDRVFYGYAAAYKTAAVQPINALLREGNAPTEHCQKRRIAPQKSGGIWISLRRLTGRLSPDGKRRSDRRRERKALLWRDVRADGKLVHWPVPSTFHVPEVSWYEATRDTRSRCRPRRTRGVRTPQQPTWGRARCILQRRRTGRARSRHRIGQRSNDDFHRFHRGRTRTGDVRIGALTRGQDEKRSRSVRLTGRLAPEAF